jgi:predicted branched-subunit amino acid permease
MTGARADFTRGVREVLPLIPGLMPFGVITGVTAINVGLSDVQTIFMAATTFGGAAQLATFDVMADSAPLAVVVLTGLLVNVRFSMFSAGVAPYLQHLSRPWKWVSGFFLSTPGYVLTVPAFESDDVDSRLWYYLGASIPVWLNWQLANIAGVVMGARVPPELQLDFFIPLVFMALLVKMLEGRAMVVAGATAGVLGLGGQLMPLNLGIIVAAFGGVGAGLVAKRRGQR